MIKRIKLGALLLSGVLVLVACSNENKDQIETKAETNVETKVETSIETKVETKVETKLETETNNNDQNQVSNVDINKAVEIFYNKFGDKAINITQIDYDRDHGKYTYEIEGWKDNKEYKLEIDAETENILEQKSEIDNDIDKDDIIISLDKIVGPKKAIEEALKQSKSNKIEGWDLHTDDGVLVYEVDVKDGEDVIISANDGSFIKFD